MQIRVLKITCARKLDHLSFLRVVTLTLRKDTGLSRACLFESSHCHIVICVP